MLDTNILIFSLRHPDSKCARTIANHLGKDICISVITYAELEFGIRNSSNPVKNREAIQRILAGIPVVDYVWFYDVEFDNDFTLSLPESCKYLDNSDFGAVSSTLKVNGNLTINLPEGAGFNISYSEEQNPQTDNFPKYFSLCKTPQVPQG